METLITIDRIDLLLTLLTITLCSILFGCFIILALWLRSISNIFGRGNK